MKKLKEVKKKTRKREEIEGWQNKKWRTEGRRNENKNERN